MAAPSLTYTLSNGSTADASQVMQNFNDLLNGYTDGTKDLSISALTCAGTATLNGNINLGNASGDDLTITASLASSIPIKTTNSYDIGSSTLGLRALYFGANSQTCKIQGSSSMSATWTLTLPVSAGTSGQVMQTDGAGVATWGWYGHASNSAKSTNYTITDTDGIGTILQTTGAGDNTITLPTLADNLGRVITIKKVDSGAGKLIIDGEGSETIDGTTTVTLFAKYETITIRAETTEWRILNWVPGNWVSYTPTGAWSSNVTYTGAYRKDNLMLEVWIKIACSGAPTSAALTINIPSGHTIDTSAINTDTDNANLGQVTVKQNTGSNYYLGAVNYATSSTVTATTYTVSGSRVDRTTVTQAAPFTFGASDEVHIYFRVPVTQV